MKVTLNYNKNILFFYFYTNKLKKTKRKTLEIQNSIFHNKLNS